MRNILVLVLVISVATGVFGQSSETRKIGTFKGVSGSQGIDIYLKKGDKESAKIDVTGNGISLSDVITEVSGSNLKIHLSGRNHNGKNTIKVYVTYVNLNKISASSASNIFSEGAIKSSDMDLSASSAGSIEVTLEATSVNIETSSAGDVVVEGKTSSLTAEAESAGDIDAYKLIAENVNVTTNSGGVAKVSVSKAFVATANSGGSIRYRGNPTKTMTNATSGGSVKKSN